MKLYQFWPADLPIANWLFHTPGRKKNVPDPPYDAFVCGRCGRFSFDEVFALGFDEISPFIRVKADVFASDEGFLCINNRFKDLIEAEQLPGLALKPAGKTGWNVINVVTRFDVRESVFQRTRQKECPECGRAEMIGSLRHRGQLLSLPESETFFSTRLDRQGSGASDRDLLMTEGIVKALRRGKIKGGILEELLDEELDAALTLAWQRREPVKRPRGSRIVL